MTTMISKTKLCSLGRVGAALSLMASAVVAAGCGDIATVMLSPKATLVSIAVMPATPSIAKGTTQQFAATGTYSDNTTHDLSATVAWTSATAATATISSTGLATSVAAGTTLITATSGTVSGSTTLTVTIGMATTLVSIVVMPPNPSIAKGTTQQFAATGTYDDGSTQDLSATATWSSAAAATATVSSAGLATGVAAGTTVITATSAGVNGTTTLTVKPVATVLTSIAVTPVAPIIHGVTKKQFTATATFDDATTQDFTSIVTWSSATLATATVSNTGGTNGQVTAVSNGTTVITATRGLISGSTTLTVAKVTLVSIAVTPTNPSIARGTPQQFTATGAFADATTEDLSAIVTWTAATVAIATISATGLATGVGFGVTSISAQLGAVNGSTTLTVTTAHPVSIVVTPVTPTIAAGTKQQFTATATFDDATTQDITSIVTWASETVATATISNVAGTKGSATTVAEGTTIISATSGTITGKATLTVTTTPLMSIVVTPPTPSLAKGTKLKLVATGTFADTTRQDLTAQVTWASATPAAATISNAAGSVGEATAVALGTSVISATLTGVSGTTTLTVTDAKVVSIAVTPAAPAVAKGTKQQFTATGTFDDGTVQDLTAMATWASATAATATISAGGEATTLAAGTSVISATSGTISGNSTLTVSDPKLVTIVVTPAVPAISKGTNQQLTATGIFDDATTQNLTTMVTWSSANLATATVSNAAGTNGQVTAVNTGTSVITATSGLFSGNTTLTVTTAPLVSIDVTPAMPSVAKGSTQQFTATATYGDNTTQDVTTVVTWASATVATATISNAAGSNGLASTVAEGTSVISASVGTITSMVMLTVTAAKLVTIAVTPHAR
jgi:uncharacterized protein YjdB